MPDEVIAYHEAGHMVAAWDLGLPVAGASMVPDSESFGHVWVPFEERVHLAKRNTWVTPTVISPPGGSHSIFGSESRP